MPPSTQVPTPHQQARHARSDVLSRLVHLGVPWALFAAITIAGNALYIALGKAVDHGSYIPLTVALVLVAGIAAGGFDHHLRRTRATAVGRNIGPVTTWAGTAVTSAFLLEGYAVPLILVYGAGGLLASLCWSLWLHADAHDITRAFSQAAITSGLGPASLRPARAPRQPRQPRRRAAQPAALPAAPAPGQAPPLPATRPAARTTGTIAFEAATPAEAAAAVDRLEGQLDYAPGSLSLSPNKVNARHSDFTLSDPRALTAPVPWPGPSAPGALVGQAPFRMGVRQDGPYWTVRMAPVFHTRTTGMTGSGKTMSFLYNRAAEGVTRPNYAMFAVDVTKIWQFLGPVRDGLHGAATDPVAALRLFAALERVRVARMGYMEQHYITEWTDETGLTYLDIALEELGEILNALTEAAKGQSGAPFDLKTWLTNVRAGRSAGMSWNTSSQSGKHTSFPTDARGSLYPVTFGLQDKNDVAPALSDRQAGAGCRPTMWGDRQPGTAFADLPGLDEGLFSVPLRFFDWGHDGRAMAAYMEQWPASGRPLDEVSAEAFAAEPGLPASYALPGPGGSLPGGRPDPRSASRRAGGWPEGVTPLPGVRPPGQPDTRLNKAQEKLAESARSQQCFFDQLERWLAAGTTTFTVTELQATDVLERAGRSRPWLYNAIETGEQTGYCRKVADKPARRWEIIPQQQSRKSRDQEA